MVVTAVGVAVGVIVAVAVAVAVDGAVLVTLVGSAEAVAPEGVVDEDLPPVRPIPSLSSSDWGCKLIHNCTSGSFSYNFRLLRLVPRRF